MNLQREGVERWEEEGFRAARFGELCLVRFFESRENSVGSGD